MRLPSVLLVIALTTTTSVAHAEPSSTSSDTGATEWNSPTLGATGIALAGTGALAVTFGAMMVASPGGRCVIGPEKTECEEGPGVLAGGLTIAGGSALVLAGVPMIVAGAWQVPSEQRGVPATTAELRVGAGRGELAVTF